ncbi:unnamed protein product [Pleuronectes platessa]|uniref:Uncharacterized protein n=1 Tax=Pleuronectes platessa TaxID=8262 RepID=A0A9N7Z1W6_PLEPL|nr:unnamed protein product [Pleuronectes platessa]
MTDRPQEARSCRRAVSPGGTTAHVCHTAYTLPAGPVTACTSPPPASLPSPRLPFAYSSETWSGIQRDVLALLRCSLTLTALSKDIPESPAIPLLCHAVEQTRVAHTIIQANSRRQKRRWTHIQRKGREVTHSRDRRHRENLADVRKAHTPLPSFRRRQTAFGLTGVVITRLPLGSDSNMTRMNGPTSYPNQDTCFFHLTTASPSHPPLSLYQAKEGKKCVTESDLKEGRGRE